MAVMSEGAVHQVGKPHEVFSWPANAEVARVVGVETVVQGRIVHGAEGIITIEVGNKQLTSLGATELGPDVFVCIRAEDVALERMRTGATSARNHLSGVVRDISATGPLATVSLDCGFPLSAMVTRSALEELGLSAGVPVMAAIKAGAVHVLTHRNK